LVAVALTSVCFRRILLLEDVEEFVIEELFVRSILVA